MPYIGVYRNDASLELTFSANADHLRVSSALGGGPLTAVGDDGFEAAGIAHFRFECEDGRAIAVHASLGGQPAQRFERV